MPKPRKITAIPPTLLSALDINVKKKKNFDYDNTALICISLNISKVKHILNLHHILYCPYFKMNSLTLKMMTV